MQTLRSLLTLTCFISAFLFVTYEAKADDQITLKNSGAAIRYSGIFKVYHISSWYDAKISPKTSEELVASDVYKQLEMNMYRSVTGQQAVDSLRKYFRASHPTGFDKELNTVMNWMYQNPGQRGERILITHLPGKGLKIENARSSITVDGVAFTQAFWDVWFGKHAMADMKAGLSRNLR